MAATVFISESNGSVEAVTDNISNMNFGQFDGPNMIPAQHAINVGQASTGKWWRIKLQALNGSTQIGNFGIFKSSGAYVAGETIGGSFGQAFASGQITTYGHACAGNGGGAVTVPQTGNGAAVLSAPYSTYPAATSFVNNMWAPGNTVLNADGTYSVYTFAGLITTGGTPQGAVNQKVFTIQWTEA